MKNIYLIPTDQPSMLHKAFDEVFILSIFPTLTNGLYKSVPYFLYITSEEEIKEGDWTLMFDDFGNLFLCDKPQQYLGIEKGHHLNKGLRKIILTTDPTLIADGVQAIDDEFLKWFVKNPTCEFVEVDRDEREVGNHLGGIATEYGDYKIIMPQEEPKQETLEEAAERLTENVYQNDTWEEGRLKRQGYYKGVIEGAKWQAERMYSEEDMAEAFIACWKVNVPNGIECKVSFNEWFEQLKKK